MRRKLMRGEKEEGKEKDEGRGGGECEQRAGRGGERERWEKKWMRRRKGEVGEEVDEEVGAGSRARSVK